MYQWLFRRILLPAYTGLWRRDGFLRFLHEYESSQWNEQARIQQIQLEKLNRLLAHAWETVPYLREHWSGAGLRPKALGSIEELNAYPLITKAQITANYSSMTSSVWKDRTLTKTTGGSTGTPFRMEYTRESDARRRAVMWRGYAWAGYEIGKRSAYLWGVGSDLPWLLGLKVTLYDRAYNRYVLNSFRLSRDSMPAYAERIRKLRPEVIVAYVNPLVAVARWALENGVDLRGPEAIITGAEALSDSQRQALEQAFHAPVFNTYGCREFMLIASECERHQLHCNADHLVVESVNDAGADQVGSIGRVAITDLHNYGMPMIRYLNGDLVVKGAGSCACGRGLPLLERVEGRALDMIRTADGKLLPGEFFPHLFKDFAGVGEFQVIQKTLDRLDILIVPAPSFDESELRTIHRKIRAAVGEVVSIDLRVVDAIERTASGKMRVTISMLDQR